MVPTRIKLPVSEREAPNWYMLVMNGHSAFWLPAADAAAAAHTTTKHKTTEPHFKDAIPIRPADRSIEQDACIYVLDLSNLLQSYLLDLDRI